MIKAKPTPASQETTGESGAEALCVGTHRCLLGDSDCDDFGDGQSIHATAGGTGVLMHRTVGKGREWGGEGRRA